jgi:hypothetical protein
MDNEWFVARHAEAALLFLQCVRDELKGFPTLEIPEWMFDSHLCGQMKAAECHKWVAPPC